MSQPAAVNKNLVDALAYLDQVKNAYTPSGGTEPGPQNQQFTQLMAEFGNNTISDDELTERVNVLFQDRPELLEGFQRFLPAPTQTDVDTSAIKHSEYDKTLSLMEYINVESAKEEGGMALHEQFDGLLHQYREAVRQQEGLKLQEVIGEMRQLYKDIPRLSEKVEELIADLRRQERLAQM